MEKWNKYVHVRTPHWLFGSKGKFDKNCYHCIKSNWWKGYMTIPWCLSIQWTALLSADTVSCLGVPHNEEISYWLGIASEKAMATHSSTLVWKIPWTEEPGRLQSMGSLRVGHDWETSLSLLTFMHWTGKWQPTPVFLPGESQGWQSLVGCRLWGRTELDTTEAT